MNYALITGASSGIGYELAKRFAKNGYDVILVARQENKLVQFARELEKEYTIHARVMAIDVSRPDAANEISKWIQDKSLTVDYLVNNAGFYVKGAFSETRWEDEQKMILMQCLNHTRLTKLLLPGMLVRGRGGILNIGSTGSFVPGPYNAVYCAVKSFVLSFSEALAEEVACSGVTVTALCPGGIRTTFQDLNNRRGAFFFPVMDPVKVAETGFNALMNGKRLVVPGMANKIQVFMVRFIPRKIAARFSAYLSAK
ncbi:MAG TPA: SDR family oxidoreductase [Bacteroidales bacterium]|nr:SDR family oxidoreductase [Bacteroidales bacterium]HNS45754.1 SDR family oxidoreductase [Bacteroidales bacterium]